MIPRKNGKSISKRFYHIYTLAELKKLVSLSGFIIESVGYLNKGKKITSWKDSQNSLVIAQKTVVLFGCTKNGTATPAPDTTTTTPADQPEISERQTYESKNDGFVIQYPGTRTFQENVYSASVMFFTPITE